jgi:hypothetical protein
MNALTITDMADPKQITVADKDGNVVLQAASEELYLYLRECLQELGAVNPNDPSVAGRSSTMIPHFANKLQEVYNVKLNMYVVAKIVDEITGQMMLLKKTLSCGPSSPEQDSTGQSSPSSNDSSPSAA